LAIRPSEIAQAFPNDSKISLPNFVCFSETHQHADAARAITPLGQVRQAATLLPRHRQDR
jgi:hypothetical protein